MNRKMGTKEVMMVLLVATLYLRGTAAPLVPLGLTTLPLVQLEDKNVKPKGQVKHFSNDETIIVHQHQRELKGGFGGGRGVSGGHPAGNGGESNQGSGSNTPYTQGGAAVIPLYAAGAGSNIHRNNHHSAGSCLKCCRNSPVLTAVLLAYLLWNLYM